MTKRHLFSLNAPKNWPIKRKGKIWVTRPNPGPHALSKCLPLSILIKDVLKYANTLREVKTIINAGEILIDNKIRKDYKFPIGLMDVIKIKKTNEHFRLFLNEDNKYALSKVSNEHVNLKPCKIINKTVLKKGKIQLNLFDGRNIIIDKDDYKVGDTVMMDIEKNKIINHLKLSKGSTIYITDGKYLGYIGKLESLTNNKGMQENKVTFMKNKENFETLKDYIFVIPEDFIK